MGGNNLHKLFIFNKVLRCPVARQAHNLEVIGSNPVPATIEKHSIVMSGAF